MEELLNGYALNDGELRSLKLEVAYAFSSDSVMRQASVELLIRKKAGEKWVPCLLQIQLIGIKRLSLNEDFMSSNYSDIVFKRTNDNLWYLSLDPYGNSGEPHEEDKLVLVADSISVKEQPIQDLIHT